MKALYTKSVFIDSPHRVMFYGINLLNEPVEPYQKIVEYKFPEACSVKDSIFVNPQNAEPAILGDVVWTETSGNKTIGHAIMQETGDHSIDLRAVEVCFKSLKKKCDSVGQNVVAIPLLTPDNDIYAWKDIYPIIEDAMGDVQVVVNVPNETDLFDVLSIIGGDISKYRSVGPSGTLIRFREKPQ